MFHSTTKKCATYKKVSSLFTLPTFCARLQNAEKKKRQDQELRLKIAKVNKSKRRIMKGACIKATVADIILSWMLVIS